MRPIECVRPPYREEGVARYDLRFAEGAANQQRWELCAPSGSGQSDGLEAARKNDGLQAARQSDGLEAARLEPPYSLTSSGVPASGGGADGPVSGGGADGACLEDGP